MKELDTICAPITVLMEGAVNIIRISGEEAIDVVNDILKGVDLTKKEGNTISHAWVLNDDKEIIDEVLVSLFRAPKSYTREDVIEINTHGGSFVTTEILELLLSKGLRLAEPGEFTKRAFLNGRIDLSQAEAVMDIIESENKSSLILSNKALNGEVRDLIISLRKEIEDILLHITVNIDYPEYIDELQVTNDLLFSKTSALIGRIEKIIKSAETNRVYKEGIKTVILGKPNVGKSSLLNALLNEEKAIVTNISGTTRDTVEGRVNLDGIVLNLIDTAGIRETEDIVESIGIKKSLEKLVEAELVLLLLDESQELSSDDLKLLEDTKHKPRIVIGNKKDIKSNDFNIPDMIEISASNKDGIDELKSRIKSMFIKDNNARIGDLIISSSRHISILKKTLESLNSALNGANAGEFIDMVEIDLKDAYDSLGEIIGIASPDELIDELFKKFCLGK